MTLCRAYLGDRGWFEGDASVAPEMATWQMCLLPPGGTLGSLTTVLESTNLPLSPS